MLVSLKPWAGSEYVQQLKWQEGKDCMDRVFASYTVKVQWR